MSEGRTAVGAWVLLPTILGSETLGRAGLDYLLVDCQHSSITWHDLVGIVPATQVGGSATLVRVEWNDPGLIMRALDLGATGVIVPMVSTPEQAAQAARDRASQHRCFRGLYTPRRESAGTPCCLAARKIQARP